jgi:hypothetical protein
MSSRSDLICEEELLDAFGPVQDRTDGRVCNICVLGSSHVGSLKKAWDRLREEFPATALTFFASRAKGLDGLSLQNRTLVPGPPKLRSDISFTSGGRDVVAVGDYDLFLIYGLLMIPPLNRLADAETVSRTCQHAFEFSIAFKLASLIRSVSSSPIYIGHQPQFAPDDKIVNRSRHFDYGESLAIMREVIRLPGAVLLEQPAATFANTWNTKSEFLSGAVTLDVGDEHSSKANSADDRVHMNAAFGEIYLRAFFNRLALDA